MIYLGIDPGMGGALALLKPSLLDVMDMPTLEIKGKRRLDMHTLAATLGAWASLYTIRQVIVENVGAMPGQSPNGMFNFGFGCGAIQQAVVSAGLPMVLVTPQVWKKFYGIPGGRENKDMARQKASNIFPQHAHTWARKKDDGRAEAVLLAYWGANNR